MKGQPSHNATRLARLLASEQNLEILAILAIKDSYPREIAVITGRDETDVSRRLRRMERLGLVEGYWKRVAGRNVRAYRLRSGKVSIEFTPGGIRVRYGRDVPEIRVDRIITPLGPPTVDPPVGRDELALRLAKMKGWVHLWGLPGVGKTHLAAYTVSKYADVPAVWIRASPVDSVRSLVWKTVLGLAWAGFLETFEEYLRAEPSLALDVVVDSVESAGSVVVIDDAGNLADDTLYLVRTVASRIRRGLIVTVGRRREDAPRAFNMHVPPLSEEDYIMLAERLFGPLTPELRKKIWSSGRGIPLILVQTLNLHRTGLPLVEALSEASRQYFRGLLRLGDPDKEALAAILVAAGGWIRKSLVCKASGISATRCLSLLGFMEHLGVVEIRGDMARLREPLNVEAPTDLLVEAERSLVKAAMEGTPEERVWALEKAAEKCWGDLAVGVIRDRLTYGRLWPYCCVSRYFRAVSMLERCPGLGYYRSYVRAERVIVGVMEGVYSSEEGIDLLSSIERELSFDPLVRGRVLSILVTYLSRLGRLNEARGRVEDLFRVARRMGVRTKRILEPNIFASLTSYYYNAGNLEEAIRSARREAEAYARLGDIENYYTAVLHLAELYRLSGKPCEALDIIGRIERELGYPITNHVIAYFIMIIKPFSYLLLGEPQKALETIKEHTRTLGHLKGLYAPTILLAAATAYVMTGEEGKAREILEQLESKLGELAWDEYELYKILLRILQGETSIRNPEWPPWLRKVCEHLTGKTGPDAARCKDNMEGIAL